jgi:ketosteroid isomerase-like protein
MTTLDRALAQRFTTEWAASWTAHDLDRFLALFAPDFQQSSAITSQGTGLVVGREAMRARFQRFLDEFPTLRPAVEQVFLGLRSVTLVYRVLGGREPEGRLAAETFFFGADGRVTQADFHWAT